MPVRMRLIDKRNFNLSQTLLHQVASGLVSESDVASPRRRKPPGAAVQAPQAG